MATSFQYAVFQHHLKKDGTIPVKVRMIHKGKAKYFPTSIVVTKKQLSRKMDKITDAQILEAANNRVDAFRKTASLIEGAEWMEADELYERIKVAIDTKGVWKLDFIAYAEEQMAKMSAKTAEGYRNSFNALKRFLDKDYIDINEITYKLMLSFRTFLETEPALDNGKGKHQTKHRGSRAISYYLSCLRHIHNLARDEFNDEDVNAIRIPRQPFKRGLIPTQPQTEHRTLTVEQLRAIAECKPKTERGRLAHDVFLLSFFLVGMNTVDIYGLQKSDLMDGVLTYNRTKTTLRRQDRALMQVRVEPEAEELINRYNGRTRLLSFADRYSCSENFNKAVNIGLKEIGAMTGIEKLTTYYVRHTWATLARNDCGIEKDTVHEALNHASRDSERVTDIYIARDFSRIWEANRKLIDFVFVEKNNKNELQV